MRGLADGGRGESRKHMVSLAAGMATFSPQDVPNRPGVYVFRNPSGEVIYVGKARSLRKRLSSYFQPSRARQADAKLRALINSIGDYDTFEVASESEALLLESRLIKQYHPRYNVTLRDDKRFLHICVDLDEIYPRLVLVRIRKEDNRLYFGPFPQAGVLRETVAFLSRRFRLRSCAVRNPGPEVLKHCLDHIIRDCLCPCNGEVSSEQYRQQLDQALRVLEGDCGGIVAELSAEMAQASATMHFERAAALRDVIENISSVCAPTRRFARATLEERTRTGEPAVDALKAALGMERPPDVIECFDISNIAGHLAVGSMVCFKGGRPCTSAYRRFRIRTKQTPDDTAMLREALTRRYSRLLREGRLLPDLIVVDGGKGQLNAALHALAETGMPPTPLLGLAKKREEIFLPGRSAPVALPVHHPGLKLLQALRDEAHRFALAYHRLLRRRRIADSILYEVPGVGKKRCAALLKKLGSVQSISHSSTAEIAAAVPGLGQALAGRIRMHLRKRLGH